MEGWREEGRGGEKGSEWISWGKRGEKGRRKGGEGGMLGRSNGGLEYRLSQPHREGWLVPTESSD